MSDTIESLRAQLVVVNMEFLHATNDALRAEVERLTRDRDAWQGDAQAKHQDCVEHRRQLRLLESTAEDARTCAEWCKHMDVGSGAETGAAARRVLAGIGGK